MAKRLVILRLVLKENDRWTAVCEDGTLAQLTDEELEEAKRNGGVLVADEDEPVASPPPPPEGETRRRGARKR